jgi:hypothetical protein
MSDALAVKAQVDFARERVEIISDGCARTIASWYQSAGVKGMHFAKLASTGAIDDPVEIFDEIYAEQEAGPSADDSRALEELRAYVRHHGARGPVEGWASIWVR